MAKGRGRPVAGSGGNGRLGADKDVEKLAKKARAEGWEVTVTGGNHIKWLAPNGKDMVISGLTGSRGNDAGWRKALTQLKRAGLHTS